MKNLKSLLQMVAVALAVLCTPIAARAQYYDHFHTEDVQLHTGFQVNGKLADRWKINWGEELYFGNNMSEFQKIYSRVMVHYNLLPNLSLAPMVMRIDNRSTDSRTMIYDMNVIYKPSFNRLTLTVRGGTRLQHILNYPRIYQGKVRSNPEFMARAHFGASYRLCDFLEPFADIEGFLLLNPANDYEEKPELNKLYNVGYYLPRVRSNVGVKIRIDQYHSFSLYWRYDYTKSKYLSYELMDAPFGIITKSNTNNFVGIFYTLNL